MFPYTATRAAPVATGAALSFYNFCPRLLTILLFYMRYLASRRRAIKVTFAFF